MTADRYMMRSPMPRWQDIVPSIPVEFEDNGPSTPWFVTLLAAGPLAVFCKRFTPIWNRFGRLHDWLFWYGRLTGAPHGTADLTMYGANKIATLMLCDYPRIQSTVRFILDHFGHRAWVANLRTMQEMGDYDYAAYLVRITRSR